MELIVNEFGYRSNELYDGTPAGTPFKVLEYKLDNIILVDPLDKTIQVSLSEFDKYFEKKSSEDESTLSGDAVNVTNHMNICEGLNNIYKQKNEKYGDSFGISIDKYGFISALTRMSDKWNRIENLILNREDGSDTDESLEDSLLDLANYCIMTVMEL